tara:strand:+ start:481 stop:909 length:429 start_codon:yes stop_codon:yes gene_type:complete
MQPAEEFVHIFWRHNKTVHFRIYHVDDFQCVQWWHEESSGAFNINKDIALRQQMTFDGLDVDIDNKIESNIVLPEIPSALKVTEYLAQLPTVIPTNIQTDSITKMVDMCEEATSPMRLERELKLHRTRKKLQVVYKFKNPNK